MPNLSKLNTTLPECNAGLLTYTMNGRRGNYRSCGHIPLHGTCPQRHFRTRGDVPLPNIGLLMGLPLSDELWK